MLVIRFLRQGRKHQPFYKIVVVEKNRGPHSGKFVEQVGFYNPITKEKDLDKERILYWISKGAQPSDTVYNMLITNDIIKGDKRKVHTVKPKEETSVEPKVEVSTEEIKKEVGAGIEVPAEEAKEE